MPVYVYKNLATGETFEVAQRITEPALTAHPDTGEPVKRLVQPVGITFRGSGFYVTDSRAKGENGKSKVGKDKPADKASDASQAPKESGGAAASSSTSAPASASD